MKKNTSEWLKGGKESNSLALFLYAANKKSTKDEKKENYKKEMLSA